MHVIGKVSLLIAAHIATVRHGHKRVQRDVKRWNRGISL